MTHPFLPALSKNAAFREIALVRAALEAASASSVTAFSYPFVSFELNAGAPDASDVKSDIEEMLRRSGYLLLSEHEYNKRGDSGFMDGTFLAVDGKDSGWYTAPPSAFAEKRTTGEAPLFVVSMHPWARSWGGPSFPVLKSYYDRWGADPSVWRCNHNEYAAYRLQYARSAVDSKIEGDRIVISLDRPDVLECGDPVPLSIAIEGVLPGEVVSSSCSTAEVLPYAAGGTYAVDISHDRDKPMPSRYGLVSPLSGDGPVYDPRIPELLVSWTISFAGDPSDASGRMAERATLTVALRNASRDGRPIEKVSIRPRLPLRWKNVADPILIDRLDAGADRIVEMELIPSRQDPIYLIGAGAILVQIDARAPSSFRLHAALMYEEPLPISMVESMPSNSFLSLGPMPADTNPSGVARTIKKALKEARPSAEYLFGPWRQELAWKALDPAAILALDPDIAPTTGMCWALYAIPWNPAMYYSHGKDFRWLVWAKAAVERTGSYTLPASRTIIAVYVDGLRVDPASFPMTAGVHDFMIHYAPKGGESGYDQDNAIGNYGCRVIVLDSSGKRAAGLRFARPV